MARDGAASRDVRLLAALASGRTHADAARESGYSERTITRRVRDPDFRRRLSEARRAMLDMAIGVLSDAAADSAASLAKLANSAESEQVRGTSARNVLELAAKLREAGELEDRLRALEERARAEEPS